MTAIQVAIESNDYPSSIVVGEEPQEALFNIDVPIVTSVDMALALKSLLVGHAGADSYDMVKRLYLSDDADRGGVALRFVRYCLVHGNKALAHISHSAIADANDIIRIVQREARFMIQFVRFADIGGGLYFAQMKPKANVIPLVMPHFASRFNIQPFIIFDAAHCLSGVFNTKKWWLVEGIPDSIRVSVPEEDQYQKLWQRFFKTIAIPERKNPTVQRGFMPKRFWGDLCEQNVHYERRGDQLL